ncbi:hypothetical protein HRbin25_00667 [bacterium HR25]|nr:hypothetical protein HRbin25_00667 [bacterium HR25]
MTREQERRLARLLSRHQGVIEDPDALAQGEEAGLRPLLRLAAALERLPLPEPEGEQRAYALLQAELQRQRTSQTAGRRRWAGLLAPVLRPAVALALVGLLLVGAAGVGATDRGRDVIGDVLESLHLRPLPRHEERPVTPGPVIPSPAPGRPGQGGQADGPGGPPVRPTPVPPAAEEGPPEGVPGVPGFVPGPPGEMDVPPESDDGGLPPVTPPVPSVTPTPPAAGEAPPGRPGPR